MNTSPPAAIEVAGLSKVYGGQQVVADVSFTVRPGIVIIRVAAVGAWAGILG